MALTSDEKTALKIWCDKNWPILRFGVYSTWGILSRVDTSILPTLHAKDLDSDEKRTLAFDAEVERKKALLIDLISQEMSVIDAIGTLLELERGAYLATLRQTITDHAIECLWSYTTREITNINEHQVNENYATVIAKMLPRGGIDQCIHPSKTRAQEEATIKLLPYGFLAALSAVRPARNAANRWGAIAAVLGWSGLTLAALGACFVAFSGPLGFLPLIVVALGAAILSIIGLVALALMKTTEKRIISLTPNKAAFIAHMQNMQKEAPQPTPSLSPWMARISLNQGDQLPKPQAPAPTSDEPKSNSDQVPLRLAATSPRP